MVLAESRSVFGTPAGPVVIVTPPGVHPIVPSTIELAKRIDVRSGERVLELGCGSGLLSIVAAKLGAGRVVAVDLDEIACRAARENARLNGVDVDVRRGSFLEPVGAERFDVIQFNPPQTPGPYPFGPKWGGEDGALHFRDVLPRLGPYLRPGGRVLLLALSLVDAHALEEIFRPFAIELRGETDRPFEAPEYETYATGLVDYLNGRVRPGGAVLTRHSPTSFSFKNRFYRLRSRWSGTQLIVNADDLGLDVARNDGVFRAFERGIVRSASLVANGSAVADAVERIAALSAGRCGELDVGLHANLSEGLSLSGRVEGLTGTVGEFAGTKHEAWRRLEGAVDAALVERELEAQHASLRSRGVRLTHLDGHQHVHAFGAAREPALTLARRHGLALRVPDEPVLALPLKNAVAPELDRIRDAARGFGAKAREVGDVRVCQSFRGLAARAADDGVCGLGCLRRSLIDLPERGVVELMVHPSAPGPLSSPAREAELRALTDPSWPDWLAENGIALASFVDATW